MTARRELGRGGSRDFRLGRKEGVCAHLWIQRPASGGSNAGGMKGLF